MQIQPPSRDSEKAMMDACSEARRTQGVVEWQGVVHDVFAFNTGSANETKRSEEEPEKYASL